MTKPKSGRFPWFKFNPRRWLSDVELRACSADARGVWVDMLCVIHEADSGGYLLIAGAKPDPATMARITGMSVRKYLAAEKELERRKVFSRRESDGVIYCRKTVREFECEGAPDGSPRGDPSGVPNSPEGHPPSRALSHSQISLSPGGSPEGGPKPSAYDPPPRPDVRSRCLAMHPTLDTPEVNAALDRWEAHLRELGKKAYTSSVWEANLVRWERWGPARLVAAIQGSLVANAGTVFESEHGERQEQSAPASSAARTPEQDDVYQRWAVMHGRRIDRGEQRAMPPWPGYDAARAELAEALQQPTMRLVERASAG